MQHGVIELESVICKMRAEPVSRLILRLARIDLDHVSRRHQFSIDIDMADAKKLELKVKPELTHLQG
jgi:hypothetical protein